MENCSHHFTYSIAGGQSAFQFFYLKCSKNIKLVSSDSELPQQEASCPFFFPHLTSVLIASHCFPALWSRRVGSSAVTEINDGGGGGSAGASSRSAALTEIGHRQHPVKSDFLSSPPFNRRRASCLQLWALLSTELLSVAFGCPPAVCLASDLVKPQLVYR